MKGLYNMKPVLPKYACVWDVLVALKFNNSLPYNDKLSLNITNEIDFF